MLQISVKTDIKSLTRNLNTLQRKSIPKAIMFALNRTAGNVKKTAKKEVSKITGLKSSFVGKNLSVSKASGTSLVSRVRAKTGRLNLREFGAKQTSKGVTAKIKGVKKTVKGAFIIKGFAGGRAFRLSHDAKSTGGVDSKGRLKKGRLPIKQATAPGVTWGFIQKKVDAIMQKIARVQFQKHFKSRMNEQLRRKGFTSRFK